jgi:hypothetical protein
MDRGPSCGALYALVGGSIAVAARPARDKTRGQSLQHGQNSVHRNSSHAARLSLLTFVSGGRRHSAMPSTSPAHRRSS